MTIRKISSLLISIVMLISVLVLVACTNKNEPTKGLEYELNEDGESYSVIGIGEATDKEILFPLTYKGKPVTSIGNEAFGKNMDITKVVISDNIISIGEAAFDECRNLEEILISDSVAEIGNWAFYGTRIKSITIPKNVEKIGEGVLANCTYLESMEVDSDNTVFNVNNNCLIETSTKTIIAGSNKSVLPSDGSVTGIASYSFYGFNQFAKVEIPEGYTTIGDGAFAFCRNLYEISYPKTVSVIEGDQFWGCKILVNVIVDDENPYYYSEGNCLIETASKTLISGCRISTIPNDIKAIGDYAFYEREKITSITIPDSVTTIGQFAFYKCPDLTSVNLGNGVKDINACAFEGCECLESIVFPDKLQKIDDYSFFGCKSLTSISIPSSVKSIGECAFYDCTNLKEVVLHEGVKTIKDYAFENCDNLEYMVIPKSVKEIGACAIGYSWDKEINKDRRVADFIVFCYPETKGEIYSIQSNLEAYLFSEDPPTEEGYHWHYDGEKPVVW